MIFLMMVLLFGTPYACGSDSESKITQEVFEFLKNKHSESLEAPNAIEKSLKRYEEYANINQDFFLLIISNNTAGSVYVPDGRNFKKIQQYLEQEEYKHKIDFNFVGCDSGLRHTCLNHACYSNLCSKLVVQLLCEHGANPNEKGTMLHYPGTQCLATLWTYLHDDEGKVEVCPPVVSIENSESSRCTMIQRQKFLILKKFAAKNGQKLWLNKHPVVDAFFEMSSEKEFMADTEIIG